MTFIIVIGIFVIAFFIWDLYNKHIMVGIQKDFDEMDAKDGVTYTEGVDYMGGFKDFGRADDCVIKVRKDGINFILNNYKYNEYDNKVVEYKSIKSVEIESETSIKERVSIGKLVFFGVFAFGMKGKES